MMPPSLFQRVTKISFTRLLILLVMGLLFGACTGQHQQVYHIGVLSGLDFIAPVTDGFKAQMTTLGYTEGETIIYDIQSPGVIDPVIYQSILEKFVADHVDLILVFPTEASLLAKEVTKDTDIPVVFAFSFTDGVDLIDSIAQPGGNITGVSYPSTDIAAKRLELLLEIAPEAKQIWIPFLKDYPSVPGQMSVLNALAEARGLTLIEFAAASPQELQAEMDRRATSETLGIDGILLLAEPLAATPDFFVLLSQFALAHQLPFGGNLMMLDGNSSIYGLNPDPYDAGLQAAFVADKIFQGIPAGQIPVSSTEGVLIINVGFAQAMGITVPEGLLNQADEIIR